MPCEQSCSGSRPYVERQPQRKGHIQLGQRNSQEGGTFDHKGEDRTGGGYIQDAKRSIGCLLGQFVGTGVNVSHESCVVHQLPLRPQARARLVGLTHCMEEEEERGERGRGEEAERERKWWALIYP